MHHLRTPLMLCHSHFKVKEPRPERHTARLQSSPAAELEFERTSLQAERRGALHHSRGAACGRKAPEGCRAGHKDNQPAMPTRAGTRRLYKESALTVVLDCGNAVICGHGC